VPAVSGPRAAQHYTAELDVVLAVFSTGPVGIGDALNIQTRPEHVLLRQPTELLLQPDKPLTPLDWTLWPDLASPRIQFSDCATGPFPCKPQLLQTHTSLTAADGTTTLHWHHLVAIADPFLPSVPSRPLASASIVPKQRAMLSFDVRASAMRAAMVRLLLPQAAVPLGCMPDPAEGVCLPAIDTGVGFWIRRTFTWLGAYTRWPLRQRVPGRCSEVSIAQYSTLVPLYTAFRDALLQNSISTIPQLLCVSQAWTWHLLAAGCKCQVAGVAKSGDALCHRLDGDCSCAGPALCPLEISIVRWCFLDDGSTVS